MFTLCDLAECDIFCTPVARQNSSQNKLAYSDTLACARLRVRAANRRLLAFIRLQELLKSGDQLSSGILVAGRIAIPCATDTDFLDVGLLRDGRATREQHCRRYGDQQQPTTTSIHEISPFTFPVKTGFTISGPY